MMTDKKNIERLFARYRNSGSGDDLAALFDATAEPLFAVAVHLVRDASVAEDVLQETYLGLIEGIDRHDASRGGWPYLTGILQRKVLMRFRQDGRKVDVDRLAARTALEPDEVAERTELTDTLRTALATLPDIYRAVVDPVVTEGLAPGEIARKLGASPGAIRTRLHRGIALLRGAMPAGAALPAALVMLEGQGLAAVRGRVLGHATGSTLAATSGTTLSLGAKFGIGAAVAFTAAALLFVADPWSDDPIDLGAVETAGVGAASSHDGVIAARREQVLDAAGVTGRGDAAAVGGRETSSDGEDAAAVASSSVEMRTGEIELLEGQSYSFAGDARVDGTDGDFTCTDGGRRLEAPARIVNVTLADPRQDGRRSSPDCFLRAIVSLDPEQVFRETKVWADRGESRAHAFIVRTLSGGWAACAIVDNGLEDGVETAKVRYVYNPSAPVFRPEGTSDTELGGVRYDTSAFAEDPLLAEVEARIADGDRRLAAELARLDRRAESLSGGVDDTTRVGAVLARRHAANLIASAPRWYRRKDRAEYVACTYSFLHGIRDDHELEITRNDWELQFGNGSDVVHVNMVTDDRSLVWNLGEAPLDQVGVTVVPRVSGSESVAVTERDTLLIHTVDGETDLWTRARILELIPGKSIVFRWENVEPTDELLRAGVDPDTLIRTPRATVRMRAGAGGGNPNRMFLDGTKNAYLDAIEPLDAARVLTLPVDSHERAVGWIEGGGTLPLDRTWVVTRIRYIATTRGDSNGRGEFKIVLNGDVVVEVGEKPETSRGTWEGRVEVRSGGERMGYVEIANSSTCEVEIEGHFE